MNPAGGVRTHVVVGERDQVRSALETAHAAGRLVGVREVAELPAGRLHVVAEIRELATPPSRWTSWRPARPWLFAAQVVGAAAGAGLAVVAVWAAVALVATVVGAIVAGFAWITANFALILAVAVAGLVFMGGTKCAGLHCGGCRR